MPKRTDLKKILIIGSGPIVIGQACEFDYSGVQACRSLREEGYEVVLVNSNPATIMTDPDVADVTYIEPIDWQVLEKIIAIEKPCALLPTMGGQTALNCALDLAREGVLEAHHVELIGASSDAIDCAEDRDLFRKAMTRIGLKTPRCGIAHSMEEAWSVLDQVGFPAIIRPSFTMGGSGGGIAYNKEEFQSICLRGLELSPTHELLIDESVIGWKEYELEVVRDCADNCIIVCSIENIDPMGIHTGDSITVAPAQTLADKEYQQMRRAAIAILREVGVETGGSNVQFAINPKDGEMLIVEMNPRVSRSSALASKATGFPIAKVAAKCAVGLRLDEMDNDITGGLTPASFEPSIDYVVTKMPRFNFEKFPHANQELTTQMKSVGEVMAMGRSFCESLQKAIRGLEVGMCGLETVIDLTHPQVEDELVQALRHAGAFRLWAVADAFRLGKSLDWVHQHTKIDHWFLVQIETLVGMEQCVRAAALNDINTSDMRHLKSHGFSDLRLAQLLAIDEVAVRTHRHQLGVRPVYKHVDTCAAEFPTPTAYLYSTYAQENESIPSSRKKIMVLGGGPNRIGQGIEFDYCCVHAAMAMRELGMETIMVNCNPETVSTDYDISDRLYFESLTLEDVLEIVHHEQPAGLIVQFGGQTPLKLAQALSDAGVPIVGTTPEAISRAEDREKFQALVQSLGFKQPPSGTVRSVEEGLRLAKVLAYPLLLRPSYVLGGRDMKIIYHQEDFVQYMKKVTHVSASAPLLLDHFLDGAIEVDVDAVCDGVDVVIGGILEHIEQAGVHSGDSSCTLPPHSLSVETQEAIKVQVKALAKALDVVGLINIQFAIQNDEIYLLEVNPRASRTVPFIAKASGVSLAKIAAKAMVGVSLKSQDVKERLDLPFYAIKQAVFPFAKFLGEDPRLGPEMRSTGEVMGIDIHLGQAFAKGQLGAGHHLPRSGRVFISVRDFDKSGVVDLAKSLIDLRFEIVATHGTAKFLRESGVSCEVVNKVSEGRPHIVDQIKNNDIQFIINISEGKMAASNSAEIRQSAIGHKICYATTLAGAKAACLAMRYGGVGQILSLQILHQRCLVGG